MSFTAQDVKTLRESTGAGMMDCKKALEANNGSIEDAKQWLREKGLAASAKRDDRENTQGVVALVVKGNVGAIAKLKCETDFVAGSDAFKAEAETLANLVVAKGVDAVAERAAQLDDLKITLKGVLVEMAGASVELAHDVAVHIGFARPRYLAREDVPADVLDKERATLEVITRNEGKPEAAIPKIVEGRIGGFYKDVCLLEQPYAKDDKQSVTQFIGSAKIVKYAQVEIG